MLSRNANRALCPAPGCGAPVTKTSIRDGRGRYWHRACALRVLAGHFRTPLDREALAGAPVRLTVPGEHATTQRTRDRDRPETDLISVQLIAPHAFHLNAVRLYNDAALCALFVGSYNGFAFSPARENEIRGADFVDGLVDVDLPIAQGVVIELRLAVKTDAAVRLELLGEWPNPRKARAPRSQALLVAGVYSVDAVAEGTSIAVACATFVSTVLDRLAVDDWVGWVIERVAIGSFAGCALGEDPTDRFLSPHVVEIPLTARVTALPTFFARPGEHIHLSLRNKGPARRFSGRLYGTGSF